MNLALASFRIEGINVSKEKASATLKKVELSLEKQKIFFSIFV